jgi:hypothetical protein
VSLLGDDPVDLRDRWLDLQACFVDDPRDVIATRRLLLDEVMAPLQQAMDSRSRELRDLWENTGDHDTEQLSWPCGPTATSCTGCCRSPTSQVPGNPRLCERGRDGVLECAAGNIGGGGPYH